MRSSIVTLQSQLDQARERLKDVEETIKKSTGRVFAQNNANRQVFKRSGRHFDETEGGGVVQKKRISDVKGRLGDWVTDDRSGAVADPRQSFASSQRSVIPIQGRIVTRPFSQPNPRDRDLKSEETGRIPARKRLDTGPNQATVTVFSRLSGPPKEEEVEKVKITSQVLVQEAPSRKEILAAQSKDKSCKERNRRMFGALLGTLQKFRQEESKLKEKEEKKAQVEKKVEEAAEREKEEALKARRELFLSRRQEQVNIRHLEFKLTKLKQLSEWEANKNKLLPFIQTEAQPRIFFLPKKHNAKTKKLLEAHQNSIQRAIEKKKAEIEKLIEDHVPPMEEPREELDSDAAAEAEPRPNLDSNDEEMPLISSTVIKRERDSSSSESDRPQRRPSASESSASDSSASDDSGDDVETPVKIKTEPERPASDKENLSKDSDLKSSEIKIKIEAT